MKKMKDFLTEKQWSYDDENGNENENMVDMVVSSNKEIRNYTASSSSF